ncbi:hypothetical protein JN01_0661 [Entomoplasma freundtii]|uniref:Uncharacterized protein n=1 Tax=Entomoplasma freundtii TaxID=74700 RepID=A0A2K8NRH0_9MOLU|nr:ABC transporter permease [Entomoplasma freundtii]ATZ16445.1 hypothetical protein EFREU_v1c04190 [Entomoplasma freundtii]TDY55975.1 hypothetical protein JN01_0661 [Entomoplasma freundtii]
MKTKLIFKQAYQYMRNKRFLYLTFVPFLILVSALIVGLLSFAYNFQSTYDNTLGHERVNFKLYLERPFKPAWTIDQPDEDDGYYLIQEKSSLEQPNGYFYEFLSQIWAEESKFTFFVNQEPKLSQRDYQLLILGIGYQKGEAKELTLRDLLNNQLLKNNFTNQENDLASYNLNAKILATKLYQHYQSRNLVVCYFLDILKKEDAWLAFSFQEYWNAQFINPGLNVKAGWQHMIVGPDSIPEDPTFYQGTPWTLRANPARATGIQQQVNWAKYSKFLKQRNFLYFSPKFLHDNNLKIGQIISINFNLTIPDQPVNDNYLNSPNGQEFLIAGSVVNANNFDNNKNIFFVPYQWITQYYQDHDLLPRNVRGRIYAHVQKFGNDYQAGQQYAASLFNKLFANLEESTKALETETDWVHWLPNYIFYPTVVLFLSLSYVVSLLLIVLLVLVFYFIIRQIIAAQQQTLVFLKALGVGNNQLSLLITLTMTIPLSLALIGGFFGGLLVQEMTARLALMTTVIYWPYWHLNATFIINLLVLITVLFLIFYIIDLWLIGKQSFIKQGGYQDVVKIPKWWNKAKGLGQKNLNPKVTISWSFILSNLWQNVITFIILSVTFTITLYAVQFKTSMDSLGNAYERWNQPYQSVNNNSELYLFSPTEKNQLLRTYENRFDNNGLMAINDLEDWQEALNRYLESVQNDDFTFNWQDVYLTKNFSLIILELINNPSRFNKAINQLRTILETILHDEEKVNYYLGIVLNGAEEIKTKMDHLKQQLNYSEGFNIYFGQNLLQRDNRNVYTTTISLNSSSETFNLVAFENQDDLSRQHFGFNYTKTSDYLVGPANNMFLKVNISNFLATQNNYHQGQKINLNIQGFKTRLENTKTTIPLIINKIIADNNATGEIYTAQEGLLALLANKPGLDNSIKNQYETLLSGLEK